MRYDWEGTFRLDDAGAVAGTGCVTGSSNGTCSNPTYEGTVRGPYSFAVDGTYEITGQVAGDQLEISLANPTASYTSQDGDRSILCVDISADVALAFAQLPLGGAQLGLGPMTVPVSGGETTIAAGDGIVLSVEVTGP